jgi:hypothetical protein
MLPVFAADIMSVDSTQITPIQISAGIHCFQSGFGRI